MVNSLLFRWEDTPALQHHCGFCERPLSHPGARASCFGTHSEPCHRFHQAMFMRNRAHMCTYCSTIDEAHYKRHHDLVVQLRSIYESCGEVDWTIVPAEPGDPRRGRSVDPQSADSESDNRSLVPEETPVSKRERKDAKCLVRAASRARVVTQEEIKYVDSVLHTAEGISSNDSAHPANLEEVQLIEVHLRYNANVYHSHSTRRDLRKFAMIPDVDVDFDAEMERVLDTFRISELVKRNLRNCGLQGKELKEFDTSVEAFKTAVVEDLVLVKKDMMEIRMRRAGYLRYANKTAYQIVEDRYTDKDWKTGERITSSSSDSSSLITPTEELILPPIETNYTASMPGIHSTQDADRRHLEHVHIRVSGDDGLGQTVIEPYHTPLLSMTPNTSLKKPATLQIKVVENKDNKVPAGVTNLVRLQHGGAWQTTPYQPLRAPGKGSSPLYPPSTMPTRSNKMDLFVKPVRTFDSPLIVKQGPVAKHSRLDEHGFPALKSIVGTSKLASTKSEAPAVHAPADEGTTSLRGPDRALTSEDGPDNAHPVVSQKKAKKSQRKATRKAKKVSDPRETLSPSASEDVVREEVPQATCNMSLGVSDFNEGSKAKAQAAVFTRASDLRAKVVGRKVDANLPDIAAASENDNLFKTSVEATPPILPCTTHGKHGHWTRFARIFVVDQLTAPLLQSSEGCSHGSSCLFESQGVSDCPFHEPYCSCEDPLRKLCFLVHPGKQTFSAGPYNRAHGERLIALYEQHKRTKGRVMLVDEDLDTYFIDKTNPTSKPDHASMPTRLLLEHTKYHKGYERGPLMKQELEFERMFLRNMAMKHTLTMRMLQDIQHQMIGRKALVLLRYCYCSTEIHNPSELTKDFRKDLVECSYRHCEFGGAFHRRCINKLGVEKVSRWYCTSCEKRMKIVAHKVLNIPCIDNDAVMVRANKLAEMMGKHDGEEIVFKPRLQEIYTRETENELDIEDVD